jgi:hypothetical protein
MLLELKNLICQKSDVQFCEIFISCGNLLCDFVCVKILNLAQRRTMSFDVNSYKCFE